MRRIMYAVRVHLHAWWDEWERLPWHQQRAYLDELASDGKLEAVGDEDDLDDLESAGFTVERR